MPVVVRSALYHWTAWASTFVAVLCTLWLLIAGPGPDPQPIAYVICGSVGAAATLAFHRGTRSRVELHEEGVRLFRYWDTAFIEYSDISDVRADYSGLHIARRDGSQVTIVALGKSNWAAWTGSDSAGDEAVELIRLRLPQAVVPDSEGASGEARSDTASTAAAMNPLLSCRLCGLALRDGDDVLRLDDEFLHTACAGPDFDRTPQWRHAEVGVLNGLSAGPGAAVFTPH